MTHSKGNPDESSAISNSRQPKFMPWLTMRSPIPAQPWSGLRAHTVGRAGERSGSIAAESASSVNLVGA